LALKLSRPMTSLLPLQRLEDYHPTDIFFNTKLNIMPKVLEETTYLLLQSMKRTLGRLSSYIPWRRKLF